MKNTQNYNDLIGKTREEIVKELGDGFNFYPSDLWTYNLKKNWLGRWVLLYIHFEDNVVCRVHIGH
ncbi:hypothetical protein SAMN05216324_13511 [Chryseobacterium limigenitum]|uniref:Uncharacterized protein n=2 Tax=Chryseobacterium limigenitum TaxID=1612149 RepID=A0A1K2IXF2_9FLAO|nr:hypothetical protein SAMN05216324_13511 [Chryseobacterium limigenitum]